MSKKPIDKKRKEPHRPVPFRKGNKVVRVYEEPFVCQAGNEATVTKADFIDKKGKKVVGYWLYVKWR